MQLKPILALLLLAVGTYLCADGYKFFRDPRSPRKISVDSKKTMELFRNGQVNFEIVQGKTSVARYAAKELAHQLSRVLGVKITVSGKVTNKKYAIIVGDAALAKKHGMDPATLDRDGFFIRTVGNRIIIAGDDAPNADATRHGYFKRGTIFGVYDFLERFAGVRYYFPGEMGTVAPRVREWILPAIDIVERPDSQYRQIYAVYSGPEEKRSGYLYSGYTQADHYRDREYQLRLLTHNMHSTHGLAHLGLKERFAKTNPEYFALSHDGKRYNGTDVLRGSGSDYYGHICFSSKALTDEIVKDGIALLSGKGAKSRGAVRPGSNTPYTTMRPDQRPFFCIMPNDSMAACYCKGCAPHFTSYAKGKPDKKCSDFVWNWMIDLAERIQKSGVEGYVTTMCYNPYHMMPPRALPSNVIVRLALPGPWIKPERMAPDMANLKAWRDKSNGRICLWIYMINAGQRNHSEIPHMTPAAAGAYMKATAKDSFGVFMECENENYLSGYLNYYVISRVTWDKNTDVAKLLDEHDRLMFGPAAKTMKEIRERWEKIWMEQIVGNVIDTPLGPVNVRPSKTELWERIYSPKVLKSISTLFDRAEKESASAPEALKRVKFIRQEVWQHTLDGAAAFWKQFDDRESWQAFMVPLKGRINLDGKLDEKDWENAPAVWMLSRNLGKDKSGKVEVQTKVKMLHDKEYFYFGFECEEPHTAKMNHVERKFDDGRMWVDNLVELFLAPERKGNSLYQFMVTSNNSRADLRNFSGKTNYAWNSNFKSAVSVTPGKAWYAEIAIPRSSMPDIKGNRIAGNVTRGRILTDAKLHMAVPYYTWSAFGPQTPENCGVIRLEEPENKSIVKDGGFAIPMRWIKGKYNSPWYGAKGVKVPYSTEQFRTNGRSVILDNVSHTVMQYIPEVKPGTKYRLSFYIKVENVKPLGAASGFTMRLGFMSNQSIRPFARGVTGNANWRRYVFDVTTPKNLGDIKRASICFYFKNATGRVLLDEVSLVEIK